MTGTIKKWGNSLGMRFPKALLDQFNIKDGDQVEIIVGENGFELKVKKKKMTVEEMFAGVTKADLLDQYEDWGDVGQEIMDYEGQ